jgi:hypothetical protein
MKVVAIGNELFVFWKKVNNFVKNIRKWVDKKANGW